MAEMELTVDGDALTDTSEKVLKEGSHTFECISKASCPAASIEWTVDGTIQGETNGAPTANSVDSNKYDYTSTYTTDITTASCGKDIVCSASNDGTSGSAPSITVTMMISSLGEPSITLTAGDATYSIDDPMATLTHGVSYTFTCSVDDSDPDANIDWTLDQAVSGQLTQNAVTATETTLDCTETDASGDITFVATCDEHQNQVLTCQASSDVFNSPDCVKERMVTLLIDAAPTFDGLTLKVDGEEYAHNDNVVLSEGEHTFECISEGTCPAATMEWKINDGVQAQATSQSTQNGGLYDTTTTIVRAITYDMCGQVVSCSAMTPETTDDPPLTDITILVISTPDPAGSWPFIDLTTGSGSYTMNDPIARLEHGVSYTFTCSVDDADPDANIQWRIEQLQTGPLVETAFAQETEPDCTDGTTGEISFEAICDEHHEQDMTCTVSNEHFTKDRSVTILLDAPTSGGLTMSVDGNQYTSDSDVFLMEGEHTFECLSEDTCPAATIEWKVNDVIQAEDMGVETSSGGLYNYLSTITRNVEYSMCGQVISCSASTPGLTGDPPTIEIKIFVISPPESVSPWISLSSGTGLYSTNEPTAILANGASYTFTCRINSADPDTSLVWVLEQLESGERQENVSNALEMEPDCSADSKTGEISFVADIDEHFDQALTCMGSNEHFMIQRKVTLQVQVALFSFEACLYIVNERSNAVQVRVQMTPNVGDSFVQNITGSVNVETTSISASPAFDFESRNVVLKFDQDVTQQEFSVALTDNRDLEDTESFRLTLSEPNGGILGACNNATIVILDDDGFYTFTQPIYNTLESDNEVAVIIKREGNLNTQGSVGLNYVSTTARQGDDYTVRSSNTVLFPPGSTEERFFIVPIDDFAVEDVEKIELYLVNPVNGRVDGIRTTDVDITDDDATFCLDVFPTVIVEDVGNIVTATVTRKGYLDKEVILYLRTVTSSRKKRADDTTLDVIPVDIEIICSPGQSICASVPIMIQDDDEVESTETFRVELYGIPEEAIGEQTQMEVTIRDDIDIQNNQELTVVDQNQNSAIQNEDFRIPDFVNFPEGSDDAVVICEIINDDIRESRETFDLALTRNGFPLSTVTVLILDDDEVIVRDDDEEGLNDTTILLIGVGAALVVIILIVAVILLALCARSLLTTPRQQPGPVPPPYYVRGQPPLYARGKY